MKRYKIWPEFKRRRGKREEAREKGRERVEQGKGEKEARRRREEARDRKGKRWRSKRGEERGNGKCRRGMLGDRMRGIFKGRERKGWEGRKERSEGREG